MREEYFLILWHHAKHHILLPLLHLRVSFQSAILACCLASSALWGCWQLYWATLGVVETRATGSGRLARIRTISSDLFSVTMKIGPWEKSNPMTVKYVLKSISDVENMLKDLTSSYKVRRPGNRLRSIDTAYVPYKNRERGEDACQYYVVSRRDLGMLSPANGDKEETFWARWARVARLSERAGVSKLIKDEPGSGSDHQAHLPPINNLSRDGSEDITVCCMMDGHGGSQVSHLLKRTLGAVLVNALAQLGEDAQDEAKVTACLEQTVQQLDEDLQRIPSLVASGQLGDPTKFESLPEPAPTLLHLSTCEAAGACVTAVIIDLQYSKMYAINLGDCRAAIGWWNPDTEKWRCDRLSEVGDMRCEIPTNAPGELLTRDAHQDEEPTQVIVDHGNDHHRLLGNNELTRAVGDSEYKRDPAEMRWLEKVFGFKYTWPIKPHVRSPYLANDPEIIVRDLHPDNGEELKLLILGTDGLWDPLASEEAVLLAAAKMQQETNGLHSNKKLAEKYPQVQSDAPRPWPEDDLPGTTEKTSSGTWCFKKEDTPAVHLIRNAIGRGDQWLMRRFLSMEGNLTRRTRDDTTVMVLQFGQND